MTPVYLPIAALSWLELGDSEHAERLWAEGESLPVDATPLGRSLAALVRAFVAGAKQDYSRWAEDLSRSEEGFRSFGDETGLHFIAWQRALVRLEQGDGPAARADLNELLHQPVVARHRGLRLALLESQLSISAALDNAADVQSLRHHFDLARRQVPSPALDLRAYRALAGFYTRQGDLIQAESAYRIALTAAGKLYGALPGEEDRQRFQECQQGLLQEVESCLRQLGKHEVVEQLPKIFPRREELAQQRWRAQEQSNARQQRTGLLVALIDLLGGLRGCELIAKVVGGPLEK